MTATCPAGHQSATDDYCDTCGAPIATASPPADDPTLVSAPVTSGAPAGPACPSCGSPRTAGDAFCEVCGLDFATGQLPAAPPPPVAAAAGAGVATAEWVALVEADRAFFETNQADTAAGLTFPEDLPSREIPLLAAELLIGRRSEKTGVFPDIDLAAPIEDPGVSRRHAILRRQGSGAYAVIDQGSTNGTRLNDSSSPIQPGAEIPLKEGDRLRVGAWTRITVNRVAGVPPMAP